MNVQDHEGNPNARYHIEPERSPEDYFARQHIIHSAMRKAFGNAFYSANKY